MESSRCSILARLFIFPTGVWALRQLILWCNAFEGHFERALLTKGVTLGVSVSANREGGGRAMPSNMPVVAQAPRNINRMLEEDLVGFLDGFVNYPHPATSHLFAPGKAGCVTHLRNPRESAYETPVKVLNVALNFMELPRRACSISTAVCCLYITRPAVLSPEGEQEWVLCDNGTYSSGLFMYRCACASGHAVGHLLY